MKTLIRGGTVFDGCGTEGIWADVLIESGRITAVEPGISIEDAHIIDAEGRAVTPGFVDIHRHCDAAALIDENFGELELKQGITTTLAGQCGLAPLPSSGETRAELYDFLEPVVGKIPPGLHLDSYEAYLQMLRAKGLPLNMGFLAAAGAVKIAVKGFSRAPYAPQELARAADYVRQAMRAGALGVSLGIMYPPELYSTVGEMAAVVKPAAELGGVLYTHIRGEGDHLLPSIKEVIEIAERAGMPLHISHFKSTGLKNWRGGIHRAIEAIESARARGLDVTADFYPYDGGSSTIVSLIPPTMLEDGVGVLIKSLMTEAGRERLRREISRVHDNWDNMALSIGWDRILISSVSQPEHQCYTGKSMAELSPADPSQLVAELLLTEGGKTGIIVLSMAQEDIDEIARLPWSFVISDALYGGGGHPHPRLYGAFPKLLRDYVNRGVLSWPAALRKMTSLPARRAGLRDRGQLRPGYKADIAIFDPKRFKDKATYADPKQFAVGMEYVIIGGAVALDRGQVSEKQKGEILRGCI